MSANRISGGSIDATNVTITNLNASNISSGTLSAARIRLYGEMTVYTGATGTGTGGSLGYYTGFDGQVTTAGIGMKSSSGQIACTSAGVSIRGGSGSYLGEVFCTSGGVGIRYNYGTEHPTVYLSLENSLYSLHPATAGSVNLGDSSYKWGQIYSTSSTISTSDRQAKHDISYDIDDYEALWDELKPVKYKFNDGTSNRYHTGFISQDIEDSLERIGMSSLDFAAFIKSPKYNEDMIDGYNYALRYEEIIALNTLKIKKLEARIAALGG